YSRELETLKGEQALRREYEVFRDQAALQHLQRQIEELYSPLVGLIQYGDVVNQVESAKIPPADRSEKTPKIRRYFVEKYYLPLNAQVSDLIRTKIYLLDSDAIPESFQQFLLHAAQFECLYNMWKDIDEDSANIPGIEYPKTFKQEVRSSLDQLRQTYNEYTKRLNKAI
ncbi:MAG TPA: hypothetical protein VK868_07110, partial [Pyrinomonadaceae bacterium]|nr:hypothetical protein [Pyrinomonadaceae bacterium]